MGQRRKSFQIIAVVLTFALAQAYTLGAAHHFRLYISPKLSWMKLLPYFVALARQLSVGDALPTLI